MASLLFVSSSRKDRRIVCRFIFFESFRRRECDGVCRGDTQGAGA